MAAVNVTSVNILNNPSPFQAPLQFEIQYECATDLQHDLEWRITYVGSAESEEYDQVLDSVLVGPVGPGQYKFVLQTDAPDASKLPQDDIVGVTVILLTCLYQDKEFLRIGYYVNTDYPDEESRENPPDMVEIERLMRSILADKPRVTRFPIEWDQTEQVPSIGNEVGNENQPPVENFATQQPGQYFQPQQGKDSQNLGQPHHTGDLGQNYSHGFGQPTQQHEGAVGQTGLFSGLNEGFQQGGLSGQNAGLNSYQPPAQAVSGFSNAMEE